MNTQSWGALSYFLQMGKTKLLDTKSERFVQKKPNAFFFELDFLVDYLKTIFCVRN